MERLIVHPCHRPLLKRLRLTSCRAILEHCVSAVRAGAKTSVAPASLGSLAVFYKQYEFAKPSWRFALRASKAVREWRSYEAFTRLGVPCAEPVACGEERDALGRLRRAFIITVAVHGAQQLDHFVENRCVEGSPTRRVRLTMLRELARMTRRMHDGGFFHNDLHWRNILVSIAQAGEPQLRFIDCPRGRYERVPMLRRHRTIKDLATLDRTAAQRCSASERFAFVREYLGAGASPNEVKSLVRAVRRYLSRRW